MNYVPLWGKIIEKNPDESVSVKWIMGRNHEEHGKVTTVGRYHIINKELLSIPVGEWFYGTVNHGLLSMMDWIQKPLQCSSPEDYGIDSRNVDTPSSDLDSDFVQFVNRRNRLESVYKKNIGKLERLYFSILNSVENELPEKILLAIRTEYVLAEKTEKEKRDDLVEKEKSGSLSRKEFLLREKQIRAERYLGSIQFIFSILGCFTYEL